MTADLRQLHKEAAALAAVSSPHALNLPAKLYWADLPQEKQGQLGRVGITVSEFKIAVFTATQVPACVRAA